MKYFPYASITMEQILTFVNVAKNLNMTKSAEELSVTQSAISKRINILEEITGVVLFSKHKNVLRLTPAGKFLFEKFTVEYKNIREAVEGARRIQKNSKLTLNIGMSHGFDPNSLIDIIEEYRKIHPEMKITVTQWRGESIVDRLLDGELDVLICHSVHVEGFSQLEYSTYSRMPMFWVVSKNNPILRKENFNAGHLLECDIVCALPRIEELTVLANDIFECVGNKKNHMRIATNVEEVYFDIMINNKVALSTISDLWKKNLNEIVLIPCREIGYDLCICTNKDREQKTNDFIDTFHKYLDKPGSLGKINDFVGLSIYNELIKKYV